MSVECRLPPDEGETSDLGATTHVDSRSVECQLHLRWGQTSEVEWAGDIPTNAELSHLLAERAFPMLRAARTRVDGRGASVETEHMVVQTRCSRSQAPRTPCWDNIFR